MKRIIKVLSGRRAGFTQNEIAEKTGIKTGGSLTKMLSALIASDFVLRYVPFGCSKRDERYKLTDPFCIFYLRYVPNNAGYAASFWQQNQAAQSIVSWRGFAFEEVCLQHIRQIKRALGIEGVSTQQSSWAVKGNDEEGEGMQIDLIIERADHVVNLCEMKFYGEEFSVGKAYCEKLYKRQRKLSEVVSRKGIVHLTLVTTFGLAYNEYSGTFQQVVSMDDLFEQ